MSYQIAAGLSYCIVDNNPIFLDLSRNRYFRLTGRARESFILFAQETASSDDISILVKNKILSHAEGHPSTPRPASNPDPQKSLIESPHRAASANLTTIINSARLIYSTQQQLKTRSLEHILNKLKSLQDQIPNQSGANNHANRKRVFEVSTIYNRSRKYVPIERTCLLDSIAMIRFLADAGLHANLVFGVSAHPFSAHSWAQLGETVLNDTVGYAAAHTPILVLP